MSMPASICRVMAARLACSAARSRAVSAIGVPANLAACSAISERGRGRLPAWVVKILSVLWRIIASYVPAAA